MARLIIVAGASGAGKTFILQELAKYRSDIVPIQKITTRGSRKNESPDGTIDLIFNCSIEDIKKCEYTYQYCNNSYGLKKTEIDRVLQSNKNPIVIIANCNTIAKMKQDYHDALVFYVNSGLSGDDLNKQLIKYRDPVDIEERMLRQKMGFNDYIHHMNKGFFDYFLVNYYDETFLQQIEFVLEDALHNTYNPNYIFVIMSFDKRYDDIYEAIKSSKKLLSIKALSIERVSEPLGDYIITERIEQSINKAGLIICDISERSPNVYYELGYARAKNKTIILTAKEGTDLPFDVRQYRTNFYKDAFHLQKIICNELKEYYIGKTTN